MTGLFRLGSADFQKGVALAVIVAVLGALQQMVSGHGFDVGAYDWNFVISAALTAGTAYLAKNFASTQDGKLFGRIG